MITTLNKIRAENPCENEWGKLLRHLGKTKADDEPLDMLIILESNGLDDCLWCARTLPEYDKTWRLFAVWCARRVQHLMLDPRSVAMVDIADRHIRGLTIDSDLKAAWWDSWTAERAAERAAWSILAAVRAPWAAWVVARAAREAQEAAAVAVAGNSAWDAARAARTMAHDAEKQVQTEELMRVLTTPDPYG